MQSNRYNRVRELFDSALDLPEPERIAYVREQAGDDAIASEVIRLLGYGAQAKLQTQQPLQLLADSENQALSAGRRMGKYVLFDVIGEGGMGRVYRARRVDDTEQWVALKIMRRSLLSTGSEERFRAERQILAKLSHPGIAHFIDTDVDEDGNTYVVMELVQGQSITAYAETHGLDTRAKIHLFRQLLSAVSYAHQQFIIHRDIKAANVLVRPDGVVKLLDFGIAKLLADDSAQTGTSDRMYTPLSAAPEQIRGQPCGAATDVYALGVLLYELVSGKPIFEAGSKTPGEFESLVLNVPPASMKSRVVGESTHRDISNDLERIVAKAIRKEPDRRYASVEQFDADLDRLLRNEPVSVADNTLLYRLQKFLSRNRVASTFAALSIVATIVGLVVAANQYRQILNERDRANLALRTMKEAFVGADPSGELGGDLTARQILERSAESLRPMIQRRDAQFQDLAVTLTEVQLSLGLIQDADDTMAMLDAQAFNSDPRLCLLSAQLHVEHHELQAASKQVRQCEELHPADNIAISWLRARIAGRKGQFSEAVHILKPALSQAKPDHPLWIDLQRLLAISLAEQNELDRALNNLNAAIAIARSELPSDHPNFVRLELVRLQAMSAGNGDKILVDEGKAILEKLGPKYGKNSMLIARISSIVAMALSKQRRNSEALPYFERAYQTFAAEFGSDHRNALRMEINYLMSLGAENQNPSDIRRRFESLLARTDPTERPELTELQKFIVVEYSKYLSRQRDFQKLFDDASFNFTTSRSKDGRRYVA